MAAEGNQIDALSQFALTTALGPIGASVNFTQANLYMLIAAGIILALMHYGMRPAAIIPGRLQALAESFDGFVRGLVADQIGPEGRRYFPFVFTLFMFILVGNLLGLTPFGFTFTSHIAVTFALAMIVFVVFTTVAIVLHGRKFFGFFFPEGSPLWLAPIIVPVEIVSYLSRPVSLAIRLFANMVAGHVLLTVLATFVVIVGGLGAAGPFIAVVPLAGTIAIVAFEILIKTLQAYVFAILTCIYLNDAVHLH